MKFKILVLLVTLCATSITGAKGAFSSVMNEEEANLFANFIQTIVATSTGTNKGAICFVGNDEVSKMILLSNQKAVNLNTAPDPDKFSKCSAIYVAQDKQKSIKTHISKYNDKKIMTISTFDGFVEIDGFLEVQMGRRNFELVLNSRLVKETGIQLNALAMDLVIN